MKASFVFTTVLALASQRDLNAAAAGLASPDPSIRTRAAWILTR